MKICKVVCNKNLRPAKFQNLNTNLDKNFNINFVYT